MNSGHSRDGHKKRSLIDTILVTIFVFIVLIGIGFVIYFRFIKNDLPKNKEAKLTSTSVNKSSLSEDEIKSYETTDKFFKYIKDGKYKEAYDLMGNDLKSEYKSGLVDFEATIKKSNVDKLKEWIISEVNTNGSKNRITVKGSALFTTANQSARLELGFFKDTNGKYQMYLWQIYPEL